MTAQPTLTFRSLLSGIRWNLVSYGVMGVSGLAINGLIAAMATPDALGVFFQSLALYTFAAQLATMGVHYSVLRHLPVIDDAATAVTCIQSAVVRVIATATGVVALLWLARPWLAHAFDSNPLALSLTAMLPGVWLFPLNKVLLCALNAQERMAAYALCNSLRYGLIPISIVLWLWMGQSPYQLTIGLTLAETGVFIALLWQCWPHLVPGSANNTAWAPWWRTHGTFGLKSLPAGMLSDLNTRMDVLMLGLFMADSVVGIYSFMAMIAEGAIQLLLVLRVVVDPVIAKVAKHGDFTPLDALMRRSHKLIPVMAVLCGLGLWAYPHGLKVLGIPAAYAQAWPILALLLTGITLAASTLPFDRLLQQCGHPSKQSALIGTVAIINGIGNALLIPHYGLWGAAIGTTLAHLSLVVLLRLAYKKIKKSHVKPI